eukprot:3938156-Rhodomonas_salina.1
MRCEVRSFCVRVGMSLRDLVSKTALRLCWMRVHAVVRDCDGVDCWACDDGLKVGEIKGDVACGACTVPGGGGEEGWRWWGVV